jgi:hypothetical protein
MWLEVVSAEDGSTERSTTLKLSNLGRIPYAKRRGSPEGRANGHNNPMSAIFVRSHDTADESQDRNVDWDHCPERMDFLRND